MNYNKKSNSMNNFQINENKIAFYKINNDPVNHLVSSIKNFEFQNIKRFNEQEILVKNSIKEIKVKKKKSFENYHSNILSQKFQFNQKIMLEIPNERKKRNFSRDSMFNSQSDLNTNYKSDNIKKSQGVKLRLTKTNHFSQDKLSIENHISPSISLSKFKENRDKFVYLLYENDAKMETVLREQEVYFNQIDNIVSYKNSYNYTLDKLNDFHINFDKYQKKILQVKQREIIHLNDLNLKKSKQIDENKILEIKIHQLKESLEVNFNFMIFNLCLKEKKLKNELLDHCKKFMRTENVNLQNIPQPLNQRKSIQFQKTFFNKKSLNSKNEKRVSKLIGSDNIINEKEVYKRYIKETYFENENRIFKSCDEIIDEIKNLESENLILLNKFQVNSIILKNSSSIYKESLDVYNNFGSKLLKESNSQEYLLKEAKYKMQKSKSDIFNIKSQKRKGIQQIFNFTMKFYEKIKKIYLLCISIQIKDQSLTQDPYYSSIKKLLKGSHKENFVLMMKFIEKAWNELEKAYTENIIQAPKEIYQIIKEIENERARNYVLETKKMTEKNRSELEDNIIKKMNKFIIIPRRKIPEKIRPKEEIRNTSFKPCLSEKEDLQELLFNESDFN